LATKVFQSRVKGSFRAGISTGWMTGYGRFRPPGNVRPAWSGGPSPLLSSVRNLLPRAESAPLGESGSTRGQPRGRYRPNSRG